MLLEHLREAPQKIASYISEITKTYVAHVLGLVKSFWPKAKVESLADGWLQTVLKNNAETI
jgi:hypothetical protein